jgi:hypothetical protein
MSKVFAPSLLAVSLSLLLVPSAHAFGAKEWFDNKVGTDDVLDISNNLPFLASTMDKQSTSTPEPGQLLASAAAVTQQITSLAPQATTVITEDFEDISTLAAKGWAFQNNSSPAPLTTTATANWLQGEAGNPTNAQAGANNSYIVVSDSTSAGGSGQLSNWLITPELDFSATNAISFFTRTFLSNPNPELLEVRLSTSGASTDVGNTLNSVGVFATILQSIGSSTSELAYPGSLSSSNVWQRFSLNLPKSGSGRVAFRVASPTTSGESGLSTFIGIDSVSYPVPEPATASSFSGFAVLGLVQFFKSRRKQA